MFCNVQNNFLDLAGNNELENAQLAGYADYITDLNVNIVKVFFYEPDQAKKVVYT